MSEDRSRNFAFAGFDALGRCVMISVVNDADALKEMQEKCKTVKLLPTEEALELFCARNKP